MILWTYWWLVTTCWKMKRKSKSEKERHIFIGSIWWSPDWYMRNMYFILSQNTIYTLKREVKLNPTLWDKILNLYWSAGQTSDNFFPPLFDPLIETTPMGFDDMTLKVIRWFILSITKGTSNLDVETFASVSTHAWTILAAMSTAQFAFIIKFVDHFAGFNTLSWNNCAFRIQIGINPKSRSDRERGSLDNSNFMLWINLPFCLAATSSALWAASNLALMSEVNNSSGSTKGPSPNISSSMSITYLGIGPG